MKSNFIKPMLVLIGCLVLIGFMAYGFYYSVLQTQAYSVLNINKVKMTSDNPYFKGEEVYIVQLQQGGLGQKLYGTGLIKADEFNRKYDTEIKNDWRFDIKYDNQQCVYTFKQTDDKPIYSGLEVYTWKESGDCNFNKDINGYVLGTAYENHLVYSDCAIFYAKVRQPIAKITRADIRQKAVASLYINESKVGSVGIDTLYGDTEGNINNYAYLVMRNGAVTGKACPDTVDTEYVLVYVNGDWRLISKAKYEDYKQKLNYFETSHSDSLSVVMNNYEILKQAQAQALQPKDWVSHSAQISKINLTAGRIYADILNPNVDFDLYLYIKTKALGVYTPTPKAKIIGIKVNPLISGNPTYVGVGIENIGKEAGEWKLTATCDNPLISIENGIINLNPQETKTAYLEITGSTDEQLESECKLYVSNSNQRLTKDFKVLLYPSETCIFSDKFCLDTQTIAECKDNKVGYNIIGKCGSGQVCMQGKCVDKSSSNLNLYDNFSLRLKIVIIISLILAISSSIGIMKMIPVKLGWRLVIGLTALIICFIGYSLIINSLVKVILLAVSNIL